MHLVADVASPAVVILVIITIVPAIIPSCAQTAGLALWYSGTKIVHGMGVSNNLATNIDTGITKVRTNAQFCQKSESTLLVNCPMY
jgi:hypothetical protein